MYKIALAVLLALTLVVAQADAVYKWVDDQGNVHYSDQPHQGAAKVKLPKTQTYTASATAAMPVPADNSSPASIPAHIQFSITSPNDQETFWDVHEITVTASASPMGSGDTVTYTLDGKNQGPTGNLSVSFKDIDRGTHTVSAILNTADGRTLASKPVTFYVRQHSVLTHKPPR